jgi:hypothetical protein
MRSGRIAEIARAVAEMAHLDISDLVAIHEAELVVLGIDNNALPYGIDFLLSNAAVDASCGSASCVGSDEVLLLGGGAGDYRVRLWRTLGGLAASELDLVGHTAFPGRLLEPSLALELLPLSPDFRYLYEQRAALAELLYFDVMPRVQLEQFARYVRI